MSRPDGYLLPGRLSVDRVVAEVARGFDVSVCDLRGDSRSRNISIGRACAMAVLREATDWSFTQIGCYFGGRHHTSVMHNVSKVMGDPELRRSVALVIEELRPPTQLFAVPDEAV